jgi:hypothetical protein
MKGSLLLAALFLGASCVSRQVQCLSTPRGVVVDRSSSRRSFFKNSAYIVLFSPVCLPYRSLAEEEEEGEPKTTTTTRDRGGKPFAPLEALLPATRCKIWLDHAHDVCSTLTTTTTTKSSSTDNTQYKALVELNHVLTNRPRCFELVALVRRRLPITRRFEPPSMRTPNN